MARIKAKKSYKSLRNRIMFFSIIMVLLSIISYAGIGAFRLYSLSSVVEEQEKEQSEFTESLSKGSIYFKEIEKYEKIVDLTSDNLSHVIGQYELFLSVFEENARMMTLFPEYYHSTYVTLPDQSFDGDLHTQLLWPGKPRKQKLGALYTKLAGQIPTLYKLISNDEKTFLSFSVAMPDGCTVFYDAYSSNKLDKNGDPVAYDPRKEDWYQETVKEKKVVYHNERNPRFFDTPEVIMSYPVYNKDQLICVLSLHISIEGIREKLVDVVDGNYEQIFVFDQDIELIATTKSTGELSSKEVMKSNLESSSEDPGLQKDVTRVLKSVDEINSLTVDGEECLTFKDQIVPSGWTELIIVGEGAVKDETDAIEELLHNSYDKMSSAVRGSFIELVIGMSILLVVLLVVSIVLSIRISGRITRPINLMTDKVREMTGDNIVFEMLPEYETGDEIGVLAGTFSSMSETLQRQVRENIEISARNERMETELNVARRIQAGMLPKAFPLFPDRDEFDLFASMDPAREVGGDFYDAFLVDNDHLAMVIADVSDKGVPSALFMVVSKTLIKTRTLQGGGPAEILTDVNNLLFDENPENLFVTVWLGILTISTGELVEANAGHEKPILKGSDGKFELLKTKHGLVLGNIKGLKYREDSFIMKPGDTLFVYTDGVIEAMNADEERIGIDRVLDTLNENRDLYPDELLPAVRTSIDDHVAGEPQFDDITMLSLRIKRINEEEDE
ncbi:MAG: SpoIIE family protein phosphatase [Eubacterium sp.]|nr:SpoIIE family protein phosphatase [Eubacterium sp.]